MVLVLQAREFLLETASKSKYTCQTQTWGWVEKKTCTAPTNLWTFVWSSEHLFSASFNFCSVLLKSVLALRSSFSRARFLFSKEFIEFYHLRRVTKKPVNNRNERIWALSRKWKNYALPKRYQYISKEKKKQAANKEKNKTCYPKI